MNIEAGNLNKPQNHKLNIGAVRRSFPFKYDWSEKQFFIYACFVDDLQQFYQDWIEQGKKAGRIQFFDKGIDGKLTHKYWRPSNICCESGELLTKENIDVKVGYWTPKDGRKIDIDTWSDLTHMRNVLKLLIRDREDYRGDIGDYQDIF